MKHWSFKPVNEKGDRLSVAVEDDPKADKSDDGASVGEATAGVVEQPIKGEYGVAPENYFGFLTGLNPALLDDKWLDELPAWSAPEKLPVAVTGCREIVTRFQ